MVFVLVITPFVYVLLDGTKNLSWPGYFCSSAACAAGMTEYGPAQTNQKMVNFIMNLVSQKSKSNWSLDESVSPKYWPGLTPWNLEMFILSHLAVFFVVKILGNLFEIVPFKQHMKGQENRNYYGSLEQY